VLDAADKDGSHEETGALPRKPWYQERNRLRTGQLPRQKVANPCNRYAVV